MLCIFIASFIDDAGTENSSSVSTILRRQYPIHHLGWNDFFLEIRRDSISTPFERWTTACPLELGRFENCSISVNFHRAGYLFFHFNKKAVLLREEKGKRRR
jgi:hypothetical protein